MPNWKEVSFIIRSKYRKEVLLSLIKPKTPTEIAKELNLHRAHISRALIDLTKQKLVTCLTPDEKKGRLYIRTKLGESLIKPLKEI